MDAVKLILRESVPSLGEAGELVSVKPGFARNFLLPQGKAILATEGRVQELEHKKRVVAAKVAKERKEHMALRDRIQAIVLTVAARAGEEGKLFGSVTSVQIAELLAGQGVEIDRRKIQLAEPIKELGEHSVEIRLQGDLVASVKVVVAAEE
jgi:large subunit ribosomal protein L9